MRSDRPQSVIPWMPSCVAGAAILMTLAAVLPACAAGADAPRAQALAAYESGDCATALPLLRQIDAAGSANGSWLYRLYYCERETGDAAARTTVGRARDALIAEFEAEPTLESGFYLANAYRNAGRVSAAAEVATTVTGQIESGKIKGPRTPMETFQLGKLYADQDDAERAGTLYAEALDGLLVPDQPPSPTAQWAARYLADRAWETDNWSDAARYYDLLGPAAASAEDLDRHAMALAHQGAYREAARVWFDLLRLNPAGGDRARYCGQLATQAADVAPLPETAPDGRLWSELAGEDLGQILFENAQFANTTLQAFAADPDAHTPEQRVELTEQLQAARASFVRAGLEATLRRIPLRETAFQSGYAPMIFHKSRWELPRPKPKRWQRPKPEPKADPPAGESEGS